MNLPLFLSRRLYADQSEGRKASRPATHIATLGVAVGLAVMIVSVGVVLGFKHTIRDKVIGFGSHLQVAEFMTLQGGDAKPVVMGDSMMHVLQGAPGVAHVQRYAYKQGILKTDQDFLGVMFKGVGEEYDTTFIAKNMVEGSIPQFSSKENRGGILVSKLIADRIGLKCGQRVFAYFIDNGNVRTRRFTVEGIYETNLSQYDKIICLADLRTVVKLNGWDNEQVTGAEISVNDFSRKQQTADWLIAHVNRTTDSNGATYSSKTIEEANPQIFSWLDLLDLNVWVILAMMTAVATVTMISGLLIIILERTAMIGLLKALGARNTMIRRTFLWYAVFIIGRGLIWGNFIGLGLLILQKTTGLMKLDASTYYVSMVPVEFNWLFFVLLNFATLIISVLVLIAPSYLASRINPARSMKYE